MTASALVAMEINLPNFRTSTAMLLDVMLEETSRITSLNTNAVISHIVVLDFLIILTEFGMKTQLVTPFKQEENLNHVSPLSRALPVLRSRINATTCSAVFNRRPVNVYDFPSPLIRRHYSQRWALRSSCPLMLHNSHSSSRQTFKLSSTLLFPSWIN